MKPLLLLPDAAPEELGLLLHRRPKGCPFPLQEPSGEPELKMVTVEASTVTPAVTPAAPGEFSIVRQMTLNIYTAWQKAVPGFGPQTSLKELLLCSSSLLGSDLCLLSSRYLPGLGGELGLEGSFTAQNPAGSASALLHRNWERARSQMYLSNRNQCQGTFHLLRLLRLNRDNVFRRPRWSDTRRVCPFYCSTVIPE